MLQKLMAKKRILSGIQPSGSLHLGNYFGAIKQHIAAQEDADSERLYFIANYHALTSHPSPAELKDYSLDVARTYLAFGLDPEKSLLFLQTDVPEIVELSWIFSTVLPIAELERCTSYKDKVARGISSNHGLFAYPVLQAADILAFHSTHVPVGKDQAQHVELCRMVANKFNNHYGEYFKLPQAQIKDEVAVVPGIDGQKMSKSYNNTIDLFAPKKKLKKQVMAIVTDSQGMDDPKDPENSVIVDLYKLMASKEEISEIENKFRTAKGYGYGHAKLELLEKLENFLAPKRERYQYYLDNETEVLGILNDCGKKAREIAKKTIEEVREKVGLIKTT